MVSSGFRATPCLRLSPPPTMSMSSHRISCFISSTDREDALLQSSPLLSGLYQITDKKDMDNQGAIL